MLAVCVLIVSFRLLSKSSPSLSFLTRPLLLPLSLCLFPGAAWVLLLALQACFESLWLTAVQFWSSPPLWQWGRLEEPGKGAAVTDLSPPYMLGIGAQRAFRALHLSTIQTQDLSVTESAWIQLDVNIKWRPRRIFIPALRHVLELNRKFSEKRSK